MSVTDKNRGFRKIVVEGLTFNWRFSSFVDIRPEGQKENKLVVDIGWFDEWLYTNNQGNRPPDFEPKSITPEFVMKAIEFALANHWNVNLKRSIVNLKFHQGKFQIVL